MQYKFTPIYWRLVCNLLLRTKIISNCRIIRLNLSIKDILNITKLGLLNIYGLHIFQVYLKIGFLRCTLLQSCWHSTNEKIWHMYNKYKSFESLFKLFIFWQCVCSSKQNRARSENICWVTMLAVEISLSSLRQSFCLT